jgi:hypothetical protein
VKCAEKPQKGAATCLKRKKKENRGGGCHFGKKRIFWLINTQEKDEELCDFEDDESAREQRLRGNKREEELFFRFVSFCRAFFPFCQYI